MNEKYDVTIIGAGIGGLVCGCYLAKAGLKVLIAEQHNKPGGYCTSFTKQGFIFDTAVDYLGSVRENEGIIYSILKELSLIDKIKFLRNDLNERIVTPDKTILIFNNKNKTRQELIRNFDKEKESINNFFNFILSKDFFSLIAKTKNLSFEKLLKIFFHDNKLKSILSILIGNLGIAPSEASALIAIILFREHILDGGYYPQGGIQRFPDLLALRFKDFGGELLLSNKVEKILVKGGAVSAIKLNNGSHIRTKFVVSNADATATFKKLLSCQTTEKQKVDLLKLSSSAFIVYLGINRNLADNFDRHFVTWQFSEYNINKCYDTDKYYDLEKASYKKTGLNINYLTYHFPSLIDKSLAPRNKSILRAVIWVKPTDKQIPEVFKENLYKKILQKIHEQIPGIENFIEIKEISTPSTLYRFTSNYKGSSLGWASSFKQVDKNLFPSQTSIKGLYLTGHWVTSGIGHSGIAIVALSGKNLAKLLTNFFK